MGEMGYHLSSTLTASPQGCVIAAIHFGGSGGEWVGGEESWGGGGKEGEGREGEEKKKGEQGGGSQAKCRYIYISRVLKTKISPWSVYVTPWKKLQKLLKLNNKSKQYIKSITPMLPLWYPILPQLTHLFTFIPIKSNFIHKTALKKKIATKAN